MASSEMTPSEYSAQLKRPSGDKGLSVMDQMNRDNTSGTLRAIELLQIQDGERILDIGPGRAIYADRIVSVATGVQLVAVDWSFDVQMANLNFPAYLCCAQADTLPFPANLFDAVVSINTIYFWGDLKQTLDEISRVMRAGGRLLLGFGDRDFMTRLPFTFQGFQFYDLAEVKSALLGSGFDFASSEVFVTERMTASGRPVQVLLTLVGAIKKPPPNKKIPL